MNKPTDTAILDWIERNTLELGWALHNGQQINIFLRQSKDRPSAIEGFPSIRDAVSYAIAHGPPAATSH